MYGRPGYVLSPAGMQPVGLWADGRSHVGVKYQQISTDLAAQMDFLAVSVASALSGKDTIAEPIEDRDPGLHSFILPEQSEHAVCDLAPPPADSPADNANQKGDDRSIQSALESEQSPRTPPHRPPDRPDRGPAWGASEVRTVLILSR